MSTTPASTTKSAGSSPSDADASRKALLANPSNTHLGVPGQSPYSSSTTSKTSSDSSLHILKNQPGYTTPIFKGKDEQKAAVEKELASAMEKLEDAASTADELKKAQLQIKRAMTKATIRK